MVYVEKHYRKLFENVKKDEWTNLLGTTQFVKVEKNVTVANMVCQKGYLKQNSEIPLQIWALEKCLNHVARYENNINAEIIGPRFGCGLAGSNWKIIGPLVEKYLVDLKVTIYDL